eukprot:m.893871 g.893871  ORF g.893871 m.893871 type:complete len:58 (-) comp23663_c3_seq1:810-983(-)
MYSLFIEVRPCVVLFFILFFVEFLLFYVPACCNEFRVVSSIDTTSIALLPGANVARN